MIDETVARLQEWYASPVVVEYDPMHQVGRIYLVDGYSICPLQTGIPEWHPNTSLALAKLDALTA